SKVDGSPFALALPSGTPGTPMFAGPRMSYIAGIGSGDIAAAAVDLAGVPTPVPGSPWSFAPEITNISCMVFAPGRLPGRLRLIVTDAGHRRLGVFDVVGDSRIPVPVAGSPFVMTDTPADLAAGLAILGGS